MSRLSLGTVLLALLSGCGSKGAVSLTTHFEELDLEVRPGTLGDQLIGGFDLVFDLGKHASESTSVELGSFSLRQDDRVVIESLVLASDREFPITVGVGDRERVSFTLDEDQVHSADATGAICSAPVIIAGSVIDSLSRGQPSPASSPPFDATCP